jgi:opacity protein-like surface antigen
MFKIKKLVIASAILAASTSVAFANASYKGEDYKGEMAQPCPTYQFLAGPYLGLSIGPRINYSGTPTAYSGGEGTLSAGYAAMVNPDFYLAGEILGGGNVQFKDFKNAGNGSKTTWTYGIDIIPGYMITDHVLGYLRAGVVRSRFTDQGTNATGWQVGLGGQTNIYQNWDLRGEYVYTNYNSVTGVGKPQGNVFNLGVLYKFV